MKYIWIWHLSVEATVYDGTLNTDSQNFQHLKSYVFSLSKFATFCCQQIWSETFPVLQFFPQSISKENVYSVSFKLYYVQTTGANPSEHRPKLFPTTKDFSTSSLDMYMNNALQKFNFNRQCFHNRLSPLMQLLKSKLKALSISCHEMSTSAKCYRNIFRAGYLILMHFKLMNCGTGSGSTRHLLLEGFNGHRRALRVYLQFESSMGKGISFVHGTRCGK